MSNLPMSIRVLLAAAVFPLFGLLLSGFGVVVASVIVAGIFLLTFVAFYVGKDNLKVPAGAVIVTVPTAIGASFNLGRGAGTMIIVGLIVLCIGGPVATRKY